MRNSYCRKTQQNQNSIWLIQVGKTMHVCTFLMSLLSFLKLNLFYKYKRHHSNYPVMSLIVGLLIGSRSMHCRISATMAGCCSRWRRLHTLLDWEAFDCTSPAEEHHSCRHPFLVTAERNVSFWGSICWVTRTSCS